MGLFQNANKKDIFILRPIFKGKTEKTVSLTCKSTLLPGTITVFVCVEAAIDTPKWRQSRWRGGDDEGYITCETEERYKVAHLTLKSPGYWRASTAWGGGGLSGPPYKSQ